MDIEILFKSGERAEVFGVNVSLSVLIHQINKSNDGELVQLNDMLAVNKNSIEVIQELK